MEELIKKYKNEMKKRLFKQSSVERYAQYVKSFLIQNPAFMEASEIDKIDILTREISDRPYSSAKKFALKLFLYINGFDSVIRILKSDYKKLWLKRIKNEGATKVITELEYNTLIESPKVMLHYKLIYKILWNTGARKSEALEARINDIFEDNGKYFINLPVFKKLDKIYRKCEISKELYYELQYFISTFRMSALPEDKIFKIGINTLNTMSKKYFREILNNPKISLHWFRHTFITRCIKKGIPVHKISHFVRHNDIRQTLAYMGDEDKEFNNEERTKMGLI